ncbi:response regulator [Flectobacillus major]|jgi:CRP-like cAMP-binding protein/ActR/RegA family two-component response regulator|uniref:response regulator n=1 Tax=Flectobacillus major TaxID=103 RepID=UPI00042A2FF3|nr:response regulator [Flectobacillus major]
MQKILLIEDDDQLRRNTAEILELSNYEVYTAENGKVGVEKALLQQPDLVICDVMMPVLDGYGVLKVFGKNPELKDIPIILLTAKSERGDFRKGMELGADDYLTKPFDEIELLSAIETRLRRNESFKAHPSDTFSVVATNPFFRDNALNTGLLSLLDEKKMHVFKKKGVVYAEGDDATRLYYIKSGKVKAFRQNSEGKELVTGLYHAGGFFGHNALLHQLLYQETVVALEETQVLYISKDEFLRILATNAEVATSFIKFLSKQLLEKEQQLLGLAYNSLRKRVAEALILYAEHINEGSDEDIVVQISREDLATVAGTATESLIRTLSDFKQEGLIDIMSGKVVILDLKKIKHLKY